MTLSNEAAVEVLNKLIQTCTDGADGYREAAERAEGEELKQLLFAYSQQRRIFGENLQQAVRDLGGNPDASGSLGAAVHRGWMSLKEALTTLDTPAVLAECELGDRKALEVYEDCLKRGLPDYIQETVARQHQDILEALRRVRALQETPTSQA